MSTPYTPVLLLQNIKKKQDLLWSWDRRGATQSDDGDRVPSTSYVFTHLPRTFCKQVLKRM